MFDLKGLEKKAKKIKGKIILVEARDERIIKAAEYCLKKKISDIILIGEEKKIKKKAIKIKADISKAQIINPRKAKNLKEFAQLYCKMKKNKITLKKAIKTIKEPLYYAMMLVKTKKAIGMIAGATNASAKVIKVALNLKTKKNLVSGAFLIHSSQKEFGHNGSLIFADCAVTPEPNEKQLAEIAIQSAETAKLLLQTKPKIALLSFSSKGSAEHKSIDKIKQALKIIKKTKPKLIVEGEIQVDAAIVKEVAIKKIKNSKIKGDANVLIFPDLNSGNIAYKLVERIGKTKAIGPILQGLEKPINDLSRGCNVEDIINSIIITKIQNGN